MSGNQQNAWRVSQPTTLPLVSGQTFRNQTVMLDGKRFEGCRFIDCVIDYAGGLTQTSSCEFSPNTVWKFRGPAALVTTVLQGCGFRLEFGNKGPDAAAIRIPLTES
jgi:hypothetical protein